MGAILTSPGWAKPAAGGGGSMAPTREVAMTGPEAHRCHCRHCWPDDDHECHDPWCYDDGGERLHGETGNPEWSA